MTDFLTAFAEFEMHFATRISTNVAQTLQLGQSQILAQLADFNTKMDTLMAKHDEVMASLNAVSANVADEKTVIGSVETLLANLAAQIKALQDAAVNADIPQDIVDGIAALSQAIADNKTQLANDVAANTPAAPAPVQQ